MLNHSAQRSVSNVNRYLDSWRRHSNLWKVDRQAVLDQLRLALPEDRPARWHRAAALLEQYEATLHSPAPARPR